MSPWLQLLQTWVQGESAWHGWVRYSTAGVESAAWFTDGDVQRSPHYFGGSDRA